MARRELKTSLAPNGHTKLKNANLASGHNGESVCACLCACVRRLPGCTGPNEASERVWFRRLLTRQQPALSGPRSRPPAMASKAKRKKFPGL